MNTWEPTPVLARLWQRLAETDPKPDVVALSVANPAGSSPVDTLLAELQWARTARNFWDDEAIAAAGDYATRHGARNYADHYRGQCRAHREAIELLVGGGDSAKLPIFQCGTALGPGAGFCAEPNPCRLHCWQWEMERIADELGVPRKVLESASAAAVFWRTLDAARRFAVDNNLARAAAGELNNPWVTIDFAVPELTTYLHGAGSSFPNFEWPGGLG